MSEKTFMTYEEQIALLQKRGLVIPNKERALRILGDGNYYNIINGYKQLFLLDKRGTEEDQFKPGTSLDEIYTLSQFDRRLREVCFARILDAECRVKSIISYEFSKRYGYRDAEYLRTENFEAINDPWYPGKTYAEHMLEDIHKTMDNALVIQNTSITHYHNEHGYIPLWVLVNVLSLGDMSRFYRCMHREDQKAIANRFDMSKPGDLAMLLRSLTLYRNCCAHDGRFYNFSTRTYLIPCTIWHERLSISYTNPKKVGQNDILALLIILRQLIRKEAFCPIVGEIEQTLATLAAELHTIDIRAVEQEMGLPANWRKLAS